MSIYPPGPASGLPAVCPVHPQVAAQQACDTCRRLFCEDCLVPLKGQRLCAWCKAAALGGNFHQVGYVAAPVQPLEAPCSLHPGSPAWHVCERCGDFMCGLCCTPFEGRFYCLRCFDLLWDRGALRSTRDASSGDGTSALVLGIVGIFLDLCLGMGALLGIIGVILAARALRQLATRPEAPGRGVAIAGLVVSIIAILPAFAWIGWIIWSATH